MILLVTEIMIDMLMFERSIVHFVYKLQINEWKMLTSNIGQVA